MTIYCPVTNSDGSTGTTLDPWDSYDQSSSQRYPSSGPGNVLSPSLQGRVNTGITVAKKKLLGVLNPYLEPVETVCSGLFLGFKDYQDGAWILTVWTKFRGGEGVKDSKGNTPCSSNTAAWTFSCPENQVCHHRYIYICNKFSNLTAEQAGLKLIHEAWHIAGQKESPAVPNAPTSSQIDSMVLNACGTIRPLN